MRVCRGKVRLLRVWRSRARQAAWRTGAGGAASDEELARRLHEQLNGEGLGVARRRTRKQPSFYTPQVCCLDALSGMLRSYSMTVPLRRPAACFDKSVVALWAVANLF